MPVEAIAMPSKPASWYDTHIQGKNHCRAGRDPSGVDHVDTDDYSGVYSNGVHYRYDGALHGANGIQYPDCRLDAIKLIVTLKKTNENIIII